MVKVDDDTVLSSRQLKQSLLSCISGLYNPQRPHSHNHGLSPNQAELAFFNDFACLLYWLQSMSQRSC